MSFFNWEHILSTAWHGISAAGIAASGVMIGILTTAKTMPEPWQWLLVAAWALGAFFRGKSSYEAEAPK